MALQYSPKIITDGLVMCLDPSQNKSYPTDLPVKGGLLLWLDASDDTTFSYSSGTEVSQWRDKSGNNFHANQSNSSYQPSRSSIINSRKGVNFNAGNLDNLIISSGISLPTDASIFIIYKPATQAYNYAVLIDNYHGLGGAYGFVIQRVDNLSQFYYANGNGSSFVDASASPWTYTDNVIQLLSLNKSGANATPYISGTVQTTRTVFANTAQYTTGLAIGYWGNGGGRFYNGDMCEILIFNRSLSSTEMKQVHTYLGQKWGISNTDRSIIDLSGNDDNGLLGNGTVANIPAYDFYNKGTLRFDGSNDYVFLSNSQLNISSTITVEAWVKYNAQGGYNARAYSVITCKGYPWTWLLEDQSGQFNFRISTSVNSDSNVNSSYSHGLNTWNHVVGTYDGVTQKIYVDGVLRNSVALTGAINTSSNDALVGCYNYGDYCLTGNVGAVRIYNKALSATEISQNYEAQKSKFANTIVQQGLVLNLDAGNPYSYAGAGAAWYDVSGNGYVSSLTNTQTYNSDNGGSINFNGSTESVSAGPNSNLFLADMTAEVWIKITAMSGDWVRIIGTGSDPRTFGLWYYVNGRILWQRTGSSAVNPEIFPATPVLTVGSWAHVAATTIGMSHVLYLNGVSIGTNPSAGGPWGNSNTAITIGYAGYHAYSNSNIASARLYTRGLSAAEILQNYNATKGRFGL
jgi:hypothetical protein